MKKEPEKKTYTAEEVEQIATIIRIRERRISAMLTAIQRSTAAGDDEMYTASLRGILQDMTGGGQPPKQPAQEEDKKPEDSEIEH